MLKEMKLRNFAGRSRIISYFQAKDKDFQQTLHRIQNTVKRKHRAERKYPRIEIKMERGEREKSVRLLKSDKTPESSNFL